MSIGKMSSLRVRLLTVLLLALSPAFILMLLANWMAYQTHRTNAESDARRLAEFVAAQHRDSIEIARKVLQQIALKQWVQEISPESQPAPKSRFVYHSAFSNVGVVDRDGNLLVSGIPNTNKFNCAGQNWFQRALHHDRFSVDNRGIDPASGRPATICTLPIHSPEHGLRVILFASLKAEAVAKHPESPSPSERPIVEFYNPNGALLASSTNASTESRPPIPPQLLAEFQQTEPGTVRRNDNDIYQNDRWLQVIHRIPAPQQVGETYVVVSLPRNTLLASASGEIVFNWVIFSAILLLAFALAWLGSNRLVVQRTQALVAATEKLANGDLHTRTGFRPSRSRDELDELALKFDAMAERFQQQDKERAQLEEQVRIAQKMEAIGLLAGGVAHDFNNLLQVISGSTLLADRELPPGSASQKHLDNIRQASERATKLTRQMLAMTRQQSLNREPTELNELITSILSMLRRTIGAHIVVDFHADAKAAWANADRGQIEQVLLNLCLNSRDAMPNGGELNIHTSYITLASGVRGVRSGNYVQITVRDTGSGIAPEVLPRIFDPFFTTKGQDRGTGLGLSVAYGIIRQHEGYIQAESEVAFGTTFTLLLPQVEPPRNQPISQSAAATTARGTETVLVVEDEELVNELTVHILQEAGYQVLSAKDGVEACEKFSTKSGKIDIVLMDVIMPRMGGREAAQRIREMRPDVAVLFCSGYSGPALEMSQALPRNQTVLSKPFKPSDLLKRIRETLDSRHEVTVA